MRTPVRGSALACAVAALAGCGGSPRNGPARSTAVAATTSKAVPAATPRTIDAHRRRFTSTQLRTALLTNPNDEATSAACAVATAEDRARRTFGRTRARLFVCAIGLARHRAEAFDVQVLRNGCFVAERIRRGQADYGCIRP
ncbi:MAG: hypothetical protein QOJ35_2220 [Solirubrobacteraceae bacterium]|nr:hypothetical protein [Solirubrobacteraceae bacterium]